MSSSLKRVLRHVCSACERGLPQPLSDPALVLFEGRHSGCRWKARLKPRVFLSTLRAPSHSGGSAVLPVLWLLVHINRFSPLLLVRRSPWTWCLALSPVCAWCGLMLAPRRICIWTIWGLFLEYWEGPVIPASAPSFSPPAGRVPAPSAHTRGTPSTPSASPSTVLIQTHTPVHTHPHSTAGHRAHKRHTHRAARMGVCARAFSCPGETPPGGSPRTRPRQRQTWFGVRILPRHVVVNGFFWIWNERGETLKNDQDQPSDITRDGATVSRNVVITQNGSLQGLLLTPDQARALFLGHFPGTERNRSTPASCEQRPWEVYSFEANLSLSGTPLFSRLL